MILTSSDKAANPTSVMGASKLLAEKLVSAATDYRGASRPLAPVTRSFMQIPAGSRTERSVRPGALPARPWRARVIGWPG
jgi:hypothetical protein